MKCRCFDMYYEGNARKIICKIDMLKDEKTKGGLNVLNFKDADFGDKAKWRMYGTPSRCPFLVEQQMTEWNM